MAQIQNPPAPAPRMPLAPPPAAGPTVDPPTVTQMTYDSLVELAQRDPAAAQIQLDLLRQLKELKKEEGERELTLKQQYQLAQQEAQRDKNHAALVRACGLSNHRRPDGVSALITLRCENGNTYYICQRCQGHFSGVGEKEGQLPLGAAQFISGDAVAQAF